jgi:hypothetical protein
MAHPPYSPDLAPSDYHLFGPLKGALRGRRFTSDQEVKEAVHAWLAAQPKTFICIEIKSIATLRIIIDLPTYMTFSLNRSTDFAEI